MFSVWIEECGVIFEGYGVLNVCWGYFFRLFLSFLVVDFKSEISRYFIRSVYEIRLYSSFRRTMFEIRV